MSHMGNPGAFAAPVTPSDATDFDQVVRSLYVGVSGNISAVVNGLNVLFENVPVGILPIQCTRVNFTGTTASSIVALW